MKRTKVTQNFSDRLSELLSIKRKEGVKYSDIAKSTGVPSGSISSYKGDDAEAGIDALAALANYFNVSTDYLLGLTDNPGLEKITGLTPAAVSAITAGLTPDQLGAINSMLSSKTGLSVLSNIGFYLHHHLVGWNPLIETGGNVIQVKERDGNQIYNIDPEFLNNMFLIEIQKLLIKLKGGNTNDQKRIRKHD